MAGKDPFGLGGDEEEEPAESGNAADRTIIEPARPKAPPPKSEARPQPAPQPKPRPASQPVRPSPPPAAAPPPPPAGPASEPVHIDLSHPASLTFARVKVDLKHGNLLVAAGARLLRLAALMSESPGEIPDLVSAHNAAEQGLSVFDEEAKQFMIEEPEAKAARFIFSALLDDLALSGRWSDKDYWRSRLLVGQGMSRADASRRFFELAEAKELPGGNYRLTELLYIALALGYSGTLRTDPRGPMLLTQHRSKLLSRIRDRAGTGQRPGAVSYGTGASGRGLALINPVTMAVGGMLLVVGALAVAVLVFGGDDTDGGRGSAVASTEHQLPPVEDNLAERARAAVAADIEGGVVSLTETESAVVFSLPLSAVFEGDGATVKTASAGTIRRIGAALAQGTGEVEVIGMGATGPDSSGKAGLAAKRADELRRNLASWVSDPSRLVSWGIGGWPSAIDGADVNADFSERLVIVLQKNIRPVSISAGRYLQPAWF